MKATNHLAELADVLPHLRGVEFHVNLSRLIIDWLHLVFAAAWIGAVVQLARLTLQPENVERISSRFFRAKLLGSTLPLLLVALLAQL